MLFCLYFFLHAETKTVGYKLVLDPQVFTNGVAVKREGSEVDASCVFVVVFAFSSSVRPCFSFLLLLMFTHMHSHTDTKYSFGLSIEDAEGPVKTFQPTTVEFIVLDPSGVKLASEEQQLDTENMLRQSLDCQVSLFLSHSHLLPCLQSPAVASSHSTSPSQWPTFLAAT